MFGIRLRRDYSAFNSPFYGFYDHNGNPLSNGCLVFPDNSFVFLDDQGQCDPKIVNDVKAVCIFDKKGNLIAEYGE